MFSQNQRRQAEPDLRLLTKHSPARKVRLAPRERMGNCVLTDELDSSVVWDVVCPVTGGSGDVGSGGVLTVRDFCDLEGVSTASFYSWRRRLADHAEEVPTFVPISVTQRETPPCLEIVLSDAVTVRVPEGTSRQTIVDVLAAVEAAS